MIKVLLFLPDLKGGGAQRTVVNIVNHLDLGRFRPYLVVGHAGGVYRGEISAQVRMTDLGRPRVRQCILPLAMETSRERPHLVFSPYPDANVCLMLAKTISTSNPRVVVRESNNRTAQRVGWNPLMRRLVQWSYRRADGIVALSNGVRQDLAERYALSPEKIITIYNPVEVSKIRMMSTRPGGDGDGGHKGDGRFHIMGVGRLVRQKGFDLLLRAVAELRELPIRLTILGEGEEREKLRALAENLGVAQDVHLPGFAKNPYAWLKKADLFVLSSRWEGFGHVIVEAMACGVPVLATRCPSGPDEIICDGVNGRLCEPESVSDLSEKIKALVMDPDQRKRLAEAGFQSVSRFDAGRIVREYERLFEKVALR